MTYQLYKLGHIETVRLKTLHNLFVYRGVPCDVEDDLALLRKPLARGVETSIEVGQYSELAAEGVIATTYSPRRLVQP